MASASLRPRRDVTAIEQRTEVCESPTFPCASQGYSHSPLSLTYLRQPPSSAPFGDPRPSGFHLIDQEDERCLQLQSGVLTSHDCYLCVELEKDVTSSWSGHTSDADIVTVNACLI
jgi:hypothetical protein